MRPLLLAPIPAVLTLAGFYVLLVAAALAVRWWALQLLATLTFVTTYAVALAAGPNHLDLLAPVIAAGVALVFEGTDLVHSLRGGMQLRRRPATARLGSAGFAASTGLVGGFVVILTGAAIHATSSALLALAVIAGLAALGFTVTTTRRATN